MVDEDFWDDLLGHLRQQVLVAVVGPDLPVANVDNVEQTFTGLIGQRLVQRYELSVPPGEITMGDAVAQFLRERGRDDVERLYRVINDIITDLDPEPGDALRNLAEISDIRLFVSTTPDRLLARALNDVRYHGHPTTREISFAPNQSTSEQARNALPAEPSETVVLSLFGQAASTPQYAIHEEDQLEWLHALLTDPDSLPDWLAYPLKHQPILFVGCHIADWVGRFLLRMESTTRLSLERKQFFFVGAPQTGEPALSKFFQTYCRRTQVQQLEMEPSDFIAELRTRWGKEQSSHRSVPSRDTPAESAPAASPTIFISYMREDIDAARRLYTAITGVGGDVWLDERRLQPGDAWEVDILSAIRRDVRLFIPIISTNTERVEEGYVFREWNEAVKRMASIPRRRFIVPVIVDPDTTADPSRYQQIPEEFRRLNFGHAPGGEPDPDLREMLTTEIRAMRRAQTS